MTFLPSRGHNGMIIFSSISGYSPRLATPPHSFISFKVSILRSLTFYSLPSSLPPPLFSQLAHPAPHRHHFPSPSGSFPLLLPPPPPRPPRVQKSPIRSSEGARRPAPPPFPPLPLPFSPSPTPPFKSCGPGGFGIWALWKVSAQSLPVRALRREASRGTVKEGWELPVGRVRRVQPGKVSGWGRGREREREGRSASVSGALAAPFPPPPREPAPPPPRAPAVLLSTPHSRGQTPPLPRRRVTGSGAIFSFLCYWQ